MRVCAFSLVAVAIAGCEPPVTDPGDVVVVEVASTSAQDGWGVNYPKQRKVLVMLDRLWVFYADAGAAWVRSSDDGVTFGAPFLVRDDAIFGHRIAYAFDGTYVHYAHCSAGVSADVHYRRGVPRADGTIEWGGDEQIAYAMPAGLTALYPKVVIDAEGVPWIAFMRFDGGDHAAPQSAVVTRATAADGTWSTATGFPFVLVDSSVETFPDPVGVALESGGTYWVYDLDGEDYYRGRLHADGVWRDEERVAEHTGRHGLFNALADGDVVHLAYRGGGRLRYRRRAAAGGWGEEVELSVVASGHPTIARVGPERVVVSWIDAGGDRIVSREIDAGVARDALLMIDASDIGLPDRLAINLNGVVDGTSRFGVALTATVGTRAPHSVWLARRAF